MRSAPGQKALLLCMIALTACGSSTNESDASLSFNAAMPHASGLQRSNDMVRTAAAARTNLPAKYVHALSCDFDENTIAAVQTYHGTAAGRAERARDVALLKSLGFTREGRDGDLGSVGGSIPAPAGLTVLDLPVRSVELNGMIGDANAMYVTVFDNRVTVNQVVKAARLQMDVSLFKKYQIRHYSRRIASRPSAELYLDDRGEGAAKLVCQIKGTPD